MDFCLLVCDVFFIFLFYVFIFKRQRLFMTLQTGHQSSMKCSEPVKYKPLTFWSEGEYDHFALIANCLCFTDWWWQWWFWQDIISLDLMSSWWSQLCKFVQRGHYVDGDCLVDLVFAVAVVKWLPWKEMNYRKTQQSWQPGVTWAGYTVFFTIHINQNWYYHVPLKELLFSM